MKAEIPLGWTHHKVHRQQINPFNCWVISKKLEMISSSVVDGRMKLSSDLGQYGEEEYDQE